MENSWNIIDRHGADRGTHSLALKWFLNYESNTDDSPEAEAIVRFLLAGGPFAN